MGISGYIIMVDGKPTDLRETSDLATRQGKVRKSRAPESAVEIHYGEADVTYPTGRLDSQTITVIQSGHIATVLQG